jgi:hypothetical protein
MWTARKGRERLARAKQLLDRRLERDALDPLHRQVVAVVDAIEVVDLDEVRMDEARRDARLLLEQLDVLGREQSLVDLLDRDALAEPASPRTTAAKISDMPPTSIRSRRW